MGGKIPQILKIKVLIHWLDGMSRDNIALNHFIASGSVSRILAEFEKSEIPDIDLLREVALRLKKQNFDLIQFARAMRLRNMLDILELPEDGLEKFLEHLSVFFYKDDTRNAEKFLSQLELVSEWVMSLDRSVYDILGDIDNKEAEIIQLDKKLSILKQQIEEKKAEFVSTVKNTEKYLTTRKSGNDSPM
ncbi:MAG: hypothetical protein L0H53_02775 [Candidatus Nitrosocosmicus sp.]|nr:hypothetical protein [Candidatus Nitrosocosmicus sp.]